MRNALEIDGRLAQLIAAGGCQRQGTAKTGIHQQLQRYGRTFARVHASGQVGEGGVDLQRDLAPVAGVIPGPLCSNRRLREAHQALVVVNLDGEALEEGGTDDAVEIDIVQLVKEGNGIQG